MDKLTQSTKNLEMRLDQQEKGQKSLAKSIDNLRTSLVSFVDEEQPAQEEHPAQGQFDEEQPAQGPLEEPTPDGFEETKEEEKETPGMEGQES